MDQRPADVRAWLDNVAPDHREQAESLIALVHEVDASVSEAIKWRRLTFTVDDEWHHWICQVATTKRGTSLVFHKGVLLDDPTELLEGQGRYLRHVPYQRAVEHPDAVMALITQSLERQWDMLDE